MIFISSIHSLIFFHHFCISHSWGKMWSAYALTGIRPTLACDVPNHQWRVAQGRWGEAGGWRRWVRESSWDARLEHGAPSGTAPQYSPKCSQLCSHPSLTQNTELPGWQSLVSPPPRAECWTWYAIPNSAAFDFAKRVTLLRFWDLVRRHTDWQKICPVTHSHYSLPCNGGVIQQACPASKKFVTLTLTGKKHWHKVLSTKKRVIWQEKYPQTDDTLAHCLMSFRCTLHYTKALKAILLQPVLKLASSEHLFRWFSFTLREWGPRSSRSTQHASLSASPKTCFIYLSINTKSIFTHSGWAVVRNSGILPLA